jgi:myo-inositol-1(or 4)-monophosphatase
VPDDAWDGDPAALLDLALAVTRPAAEHLRRVLADPREEVSTKSSPTDVVTEADRASERLVVDALRAARPDDAVVAEEGGARAGTSGVTWVLDPLDGTTNYLFRIPAYAVSLAAQVRGEAVAAVVLDPSRGEEFTALRGRGSWCNGVALRASRQDDLSRALVGTGFSYDAERRRRQAVVLAQVLPAVRDIRRVGSAALDLCWVACGRLDAYYEKGLGPWDHAAGELVAREAGARTGDLDGGPVSTEFALACSPALHDELAALLERAGARHA